MRARLLTKLGMFCCLFWPSVSAALEMAITFDDLPSHMYSGSELHDNELSITDSILTSLQRHQVPGVYGFINGLRLEEKPETRDVLRRWVAAGQAMGAPRRRSFIKLPPCGLKTPGPLQKGSLRGGYFMKFGHSSALLLIAAA